MNELKKFFDARAKNYDRILSLPWLKAFERDEVEKILKDANVSGKKILDIGCGTGKFCRLWRSRGASFVAGLDFSNGMLEEARNKCSMAIAFTRGDAFGVPFKNKSFDVVSCIGVANYYEDPTPLLEEMQRIARQEIILTFPQKSMFGSVYKKISRVEIFLRSEKKVAELCEVFFRKYTIEECAYGLTLVVAGYI